jgi:hypothetical protein
MALMNAKKLQKHFLILYSPQTKKKNKQREQALFPKILSRDFHEVLCRRKDCKFLFSVSFHVLDLHIKFELIDIVDSGFRETHLEGEARGFFWCQNSTVEAGQARPKKFGMAFAGSS